MSFRGIRTPGLTVIRLIWKTRAGFPARRRPTVLDAAQKHATGKLMRPARLYAPTRTVSRSISINLNGPQRLDSMLCYIMESVVSAAACLPKILNPVQNLPMRRHNPLPAYDLDPFAFFKRFVMAKEELNLFF